MPDETNDVNNAVSCYKEAVQFSASFITVNRFTSYFFTKFMEQLIFCVVFVHVSLNCKYST